MTTFDYKLALHCAPVLAGVKPANLISVSRNEWGVMQEGLARSARTFGGRQIYFRRLRGGDRRVLLLVYRRDLLEFHLSHPENRRLLAQCGYESDLSVSATLRRLAARLTESNEFPHEIGVFLGYPPEDVRGFILHKGKNYRLCGCWKVYGNPEQAAHLFSLYAQARSFFCTRVQNGEEIEHIKYGGIA